MTYRDPFKIELRTPAGRPLGIVSGHTFAKQMPSREPEVKGVRVKFRVTYPDGDGSLLAAAEALGGHHFNWYQVIMGGHKSATRNACGNPLSAPYVDPPCGGYPPTAPGANDGQWSDRLPWFWDETQPPPPVTAVWSQLNFNIRWEDVEDPPAGSPYETIRDGNVLEFYDEPAFRKGMTIRFHTWLVCVKPDGRPKKFMAGFVWKSISSRENDNDGVVEIKKLLERDPDKKEYHDLVEEGPMSYCWFWFDN